MAPRVPNKEARGVRNGSSRRGASCSLRNRNFKEKKVFRSLTKEEFDNFRQETKEDERKRVLPPARRRNKRRAKQKEERRMPRGRRDAKGMKHAGR